MPFLSEELWQQVSTRNEGESICIAKYPGASHRRSIDLSRSIECITQLRNLRSAKGLSPKEALEISIKTSQKEFYQPYAFQIRKLANISKLDFVDEKPEGTVSVPVSTDEVFVKLHIQIDVASEKEKINKEIEYLEGFLRSVDAKLSNEKFVSNAKPGLVEKEQQKKSDAEAKMKVLRESLLQLK